VETLCHDIDIFTLLSL